MALRSSTALLLFVGSVPDPGDDGRAVAKQLYFFGRFGQLILHGPSFLKPPEGEVPWRLPVEQMACIQLVLDLARPSGRVVRLVDVNQPGDDRELVERWEGQDGVLPTLVAPDGRQLAGVESFDRERVRKFLAKS